MNTTRIGKIARLPLAVREEVNRRLQNGESGASLCAWLHSLPEVRAVLAEEFGGRPINAQNLTEWRQGGFCDWLATQEARILAKDLGQEILSEPEADYKVSSEMLTIWLASRYAIATRRVTHATDPDEQWRLLREMSNGIFRLRQGDLELKRMAVEREWQQLRRQQHGVKEAQRRSADGVKGREPGGEPSNPGRKVSPSPATAGSHPAVQKEGSERLGPSVSRPPVGSSSTASGPGAAASANVPYPASNPAKAGRISPCGTSPLQPNLPSVFQTNSNPFKPFKTVGTRQAPLAGPIQPSSAAFSPLVLSIAKPWLFDGVMQS